MNWFVSSVEDLTGWGEFGYASGIDWVTVI